MTLKTSAIFLLVIFFTLFVPIGSIRAEMTAQKIMENNFYVTKVKSLSSDSTMVLINDKGQTRERKTTTVSRLQKNGIDSNLLVRFHSPADIKGTGFLQIEHSDGEDDLWIYLPALKKSRRLVASNKKDSFVGSDFSYGDILLPKVELYHHTLLRSEACGSEGLASPDRVRGVGASEERSPHGPAQMTLQDCYVIESMPKDETVKANSGYSKKITWVRKDNFLETRVEYYDVTGRLLKTQVASEHKLVEPDTQRWIALRREMVDHQTGHKTIVTFDKIEVGRQQQDAYFTTRTIERE